MVMGPPLSSTTTAATSPYTPSPSTKGGSAFPALLRLPPLLPTTKATTTRTRERLRNAEAEVDKLRRAVEDEHDLVERLKREGDSPALPGTETARRIRELRRDELEENASAPRRATAGLFRAICSTDLLFLIDTTGSMASYIEAAKQQVRSIVNDIGKAFLDQAEVRIAVVGYKDHGDAPNIQFLDFTTSAEEVHSFLSGLSAGGGGDAPEDVLGGIRQAIGATWKHQTRVIIHIADAPPHAVHDLGAESDSYATPGSEPHGLTYAPLLSQLVTLRINYVLLRINDSTDRMAFAFLETYAAASANCTLLPGNKYYSSIASSPKRGVTNANAPLLFREAELGIAFSALQHLVVKAVTASATRTACRMTRATRGMTGPKLAPIGEDDDSITDVELETGPPRWDAPGWLDETLAVEGFSPDVVRHGCDTLDAMMEHDDNIPMSVLGLVIYKRTRPFAQGSLRKVSYALTAASTNRYVVKSYKRADSRLPHLTEGMRCQALCKAFALDFNALTGNSDRHPIDFVVTACFKSTTASNTCISMEPYLRGTYVKYNSNAGYVNDDIPAGDPFNQAAQAFSHFTFERSRGRFLVCDLQGVGGLLTDPAVHTRDPDRFVLSETNLGEDGFKLFFAMHECNAICRDLGLKSNGSTLEAPGGSSGDSSSGDFRATWPKMADTVCCCSNKLCGRILQRTTANESEKFPGYQWCDQCWPQLEVFTSKRVCVAPGGGGGGGGIPYHEFEASRFFYESQGRSTPRRCLAHGGDDTTRLRTVPASVRRDASVYRTAPASMKRWSAAATTATVVPHSSKVGDIGWAKACDSYA